MIKIDELIIADLKDEIEELNKEIESKDRLLEHKNQHIEAIRKQNEDLIKANNNFNIRVKALEGIIKLACYKLAMMLVWDETHRERKQSIRDLVKWMTTSRNASAVNLMDEIPF